MRQHDAHVAARIDYLIREISIMLGVGWDISPAVRDAWSMWSTYRHEMI